MSEQEQPTSPAPPPPNQAAPWMTAVIVIAMLVAGFAAIRQARQNRTPEAVEPALKFDDAQYRATDPRLIAWNEVQRIDTGFEQPRGIAMDQTGRLFVAGDRAVRVFDDKGCAGLRFDVGREPYCLAVTPDRRLVLGFKDHVEFWSPEGQRLVTWESLGPLTHLTGLYSTTDAVWAGDAGNRVVLQFDAQGKITGRFGERNPARSQPGLVMPSPHLDVGLDLKGNVWLNNPGRHRMEAYAENGQMIGSWGESTPEITGFCGCCNPTDFALLPDGRFVTAEKGIPRVKISSADGSFQNVVAGAESFDGDNISLDLATTTDGRVLVLDPVRKAVRIFAPRNAADGGRVTERENP